MSRHRSASAALAVESGRAVAAAPSRVSWPWVAAIVGWLVCAALRWRLLDVPLDRDEGEYAYAGQLLLQGLLPYEHLYNAKLPGIYAAYAALLELLGETTRAIHLGLLLINGLTTFFVVLVARRLLGSGGAERWTAAAAGLGFAYFSLGHGVHGLSANAEHFVLLPAVAGLWQLLVYEDSRRSAPLAASGLLLGLALTMKQHGAVYAVFGLGVVIAHAISDARARQGSEGAREGVSVAAGIRRIVLYGFCLAAPLGLIALAYFLSGAFDAFWFWTVEYARSYTSQISVTAAPRRFVFASANVVRGAPLMWLLAAIGASALVWDPATRGRRLWIAGLAVAVFAAVLPGFYFRAHYFVTTLPAAAILFALGVRALSSRVRATAGAGLARPTLACLLVVAPLAQMLVLERALLFEMSPQQYSRAIFGVNPFVESPRIGEWIRERTEPDDRVAVFGSEPQIYFHAQRRASSGHIYAYPLTSPTPLADRLQAQMIREIEANPPEVVVFVRMLSSWNAERATRPERLLARIAELLAGYELALRVDVTMQGSEFIEREALREPRAPAKHSLEIYRLREAGT